MIIAWFMGVPAANACSCLTPPRDRAVDEADMVFYGTLLAEVEASSSSSHTVTLTLRVDEAFKGVVEGQSVTATSGGACSMPFRVGETVVWYVYGDRTGSLCGRSAPVTSPRETRADRVWSRQRKRKRWRRAGARELSALRARFAE